MSINVDPPSVLRHRSTPPTITRFGLVGSPAQMTFPYQPWSPRYMTDWPSGPTVAHLVYVAPPSVDRQTSPPWTATEAYTVLGSAVAYVSSIRLCHGVACVAAVHVCPPSVE